MLERAAVSVLYDVALGRDTAWQLSTPAVRRLAHALVLDFVGKITDIDPSFPASLEAPSDLSGAPLGAWLVAREIERAHPWLKGGDEEPH